jgi:hypothetical protein
MFKEHQHAIFNEDGKLFSHSGSVLNVCPEKEAIQTQHLENWIWSYKEERV